MGSWLYFSCMRETSLSFASIGKQFLNKVLVKLLRGGPVQKISLTEMSIFLLSGARLELRSVTLLTRCLFGALADDTKTGNGKRGTSKVRFCSHFFIFLFDPRARSPLRLFGAILRYQGEMTSRMIKGAARNTIFLLPFWRRIHLILVNLSNTE